MKALSAFVLVLAICVATVIPSSAATDKLLQNVRGDVTHQQGTAPPQPVALNASVALADSEYAITGPNSQAAIALPDSSKILVGQDTKIQLAAFDQQPNITTANFILVNGKMRFAVQHPGGAKANYTFTTSTGQIAVRGTEGDISLSTTELQVNVYSLGDPTQPVQVTLTNGKTYTLTAGQSLVVGVTGAVIAAAAVSAITQSTTSTFSEFGPASNSGAVGAGAAAGAAAGVAPAAIAAGAAAVVAGAVVAGSTHNGAVSGPVLPGAVTTTPASLAFAAPNQTQSLTISQANYSGDFTVTGSGVHIKKQSRTQYAIEALSPGTTSLSISGGGGQSTSVPVTIASGNVVLDHTALLFDMMNFTIPQNVTASEVGYTGSFVALNNSSSVASISPASSASGAFSVTALAYGTTSFTIKDTNGNKASFSVKAAPGINGLPQSGINLILGGPKNSFTATEAGATIKAAITQGNAATVSPGSGPSPVMFTVTAAALGHATLSVSDGINTPYLINVSVASPMPSTTCVPIIIHEKHVGQQPAPGPTTCPTAPPPSAPGPRGTARPPHPHPVGPPPPRVASPKQTPGNVLPHPGIPGGGPPGMTTPPPMPGPPGGGR